jgi:hypothetical protein
MTRLSGLFRPGLSEDGAMRRSISLLAAVILTGTLLIGPSVHMAGAASFAYTRHGFACGPNGTLLGSPTTGISSVTLWPDAPALSSLTCLWGGTKLPFSAGGPCRYEDNRYIAEFRGRLLLPGFGTTLQCSDARITVKPLVRVTSVDASGVEHLVAQWEDTNHDGVPSAGDTVRTGEFPLFTDSAGSRIYIPATVTEHPVTGVEIMSHFPSERIELDASIVGGNVYFHYNPPGANEPGDETYHESGGNGVTEASDLTNALPISSDFTFVDPRTPSKPLHNHGYTGRGAATTVDFLQMTWNWR